jgi:hypothetical protein
MSVPGVRSVVTPMAENALASKIQTPEGREDLANKFAPYAGYYLNTPEGQQTLGGYLNQAFSAQGQTPAFVQTMMNDPQTRAGLARIAGDWAMQPENREKWQPHAMPLVGEYIGQKAGDFYQDNKPYIWGGAAAALAIPLMMALRRKKEKEKQHATSSRAELSREYR